MKQDMFKFIKSHATTLLAFLNLLLVVFIFSLFAVRTYYQLRPVCDWVCYEEVVPQKDTFPLGAVAEFYSTNTVNKKATGKYIESLQCETGDDEWEANTYNRVLLANWDKTGKKVDAPWGFPEKRLPNKPATCTVLSKICVDTPINGEVCDDLSIASFRVE